MQLHCEDCSHSLGEWTHSVENITHILIWFGKTPKPNPFLCAGKTCKQAAESGTEPKMRGLPESVGKHNFCSAIHSTRESVVQAILHPRRFRLPNSNFWLITDSLLLGLNILFAVAAKWRSIRKWTYCFTLFMRVSYYSCWMLWMDADLTLGSTHSAFS